jgi:hypothetical protein
MNEYAKIPPTPIKDLVHNGNPNYQKAADVTTVPADECSWLGRFQDVGWALRITPRLTQEEWLQLNRHYGEAWDKERFSYDGLRALEMVHTQFPRHELSLVWPKCTYRYRVDRVGRSPVYAECNAQARHTEVRVTDVTGARVGIARCDLHQGRL